jgi:hypothetical protein
VAIAQEYDIVGVEQWLTAGPAASPRPVLLIRHDVDQYPGSAQRMASLEDALGISSTWYFRWRTAAGPVVDALREAGHAVGLHYETLTRLLLERGRPPAAAGDFVTEARGLLAQELTAFAGRFGPVQSACPHGDTRVPGVHNGVLLRGQDLAPFGITWDANDAVAERGVDVWCTDRSRGEGRWQPGLDPLDLLVDRRAPLLLVVHPNNWASGPALWWDRLLPGATRTTSDRPALVPGPADPAPRPPIPPIPPIPKSPPSPPEPSPRSSPAGPSA